MQQLDNKVPLQQDKGMEAFLLLGSMGLPNDMDKPLEILVHQKLKPPW